MPDTATQTHPHSRTLQSQLVQAVELLDEKLGSLDEWMTRTDADTNDFQTRWQVCSQTITAQLARVEEAVELPQRPQLRIF